MTDFLPGHRGEPRLHSGGARLLADIGGTNARFALEREAGSITHAEVLACAAYPTLAAAVQAYLALPQVAAVTGGVLRHAAIAIANPVTGDQVRMTNHHWEFSIEAMRNALGLDTLVVVNDFAALARALPHLGTQQRKIGAGEPLADAPLALIGAGTGLGVSGLIPHPGGWTALRSEGGHVTFAPSNELELAILQYAWRQFEHVSAERLLSGAGVELIYRALAERSAHPEPQLAAAEVSRRALAGQCALCDQVLDVFCGMLGSVAGNLAITLGAQGGVYIGGGIVPRLGQRFEASPFRQRFESKGRMGGYLCTIPTYVITAEYPAFLGVSAILSEKLCD